MSSYWVDSNDEGTTIHKRLRFNDKGAYLYGRDNDIYFVSSPIRYQNNERIEAIYQTTLGYRESTSKYQSLDRLSNSLCFDTDSDFYIFDKPVESKGHIGIDNSLTRLTDSALFFSNEHYLLSVAGGIKHYGNAYFLSSISSERFSSGFASSGWAIQGNKITGNVSATFDEITIRKKMRIYELEVQKASATNGSFWISDTCSGDSVIKL